MKKPVIEIYDKESIETLWYRIIMAKIEMIDKNV